MQFSFLVQKKINIRKNLPIIKIGKGKEIMMINGINSINPLNNVQETLKSEGISKARATESDSISVSKEAEKMAEAYYLDKVAAETPDVRADRIAEVREKIKDPAYLNDAVFGSAADKFLTALGL